MTATIRTDIHRPAEMNPARYTYTGGFDLSTEQTRTAAETRLVNRLETEGVGVHHIGQCDHCGAHLRYVAVLEFDGGGLIGVGFDCLEERFGLTDQADWDRKRLAAARKARESARENAEYREEFAREHPKVHALLKDAHENPGNDHLEITLSIAARFFSANPRLTERQIEAMQKIAAKRDGFLARKAEREAERANAKSVPTGKGVKVEGSVVKMDTRENAYGVRTVMTVKNDAGWLVWGTCPKALRTAAEGERVRFVANVEGTEGDHAFGFFVRPRKAEIVEAGEEELVYCRDCGTDLKEAGVSANDRCAECRGIPF